MHESSIASWVKDTTVIIFQPSFENTPVMEITSKPNFKIKTPEGTLSAEKIVFGTNAYSHLFHGLKRKQVPAFTYLIATAPLTDRQLEPIGWQGFEGLEDARKGKGRGHRDFRGSL
jgi:glycine/D-amino acid oxidase-like deaminating enzyme